MQNKPLTLRFIVIATFLGNTLEWYDTVLFGFFLPIFSLLFFPEIDPEAALIRLLFFMGIGVVLRPMGGFIFGFIGDRYGRKNAVIGSILLITLPLLAMSALPVYSQIGVFATILLCALRMLQGIGMGGELTGCITFVVESAPPSSRGFYGSFAYFGVVLGVFIGALEFYFLGNDISNENFQRWGWRLLCLTGASVGLVAFWMRKCLVETPQFEKMRDSSEILRDPIAVLFREHKRQILQFVGIEILEALGFNLLIAFSVTYFFVEFQTSLNEAIGLNLLMLGTLLVALPCFGKLASYLGSFRLARYSAWAFVLFSLPLYLLLPSETLRIGGILGLGVLFASYLAPMPEIYCNLFPTNIRFSGIGISYNVVAGVIGGFSPLFALWFIEASGFTAAPAFLLIAGAILSLLTLRTISREQFPL